MAEVYSRSVAAANSDHCDGECPWTELNPGLPKFPIGTMHWDGKHWVHEGGLSRSENSHFGYFILPAPRLYGSAGWIDSLSIHLTSSTLLSPSIYITIEGVWIMSSCSVINFLTVLPPISGYDEKCGIGLLWTILREYSRNFLIRFMHYQALRHPTKLWLTTS